MIIVQCKNNFCDYVQMFWRDENVNSILYEFIREQDRMNLYSACQTKESLGIRNEQAGAMKK